MVRIYVVMLVLMTIASGCNPHKRTLAEASSLRQAGLHQDAFNRYLSVYRQNTSHAEALIGMKETGSSLVIRMFSDVQLMHGQGRNQAALTRLAEAEAFVRQYQWLDFNTPFFAETIRDDINRAIAIEHYQLAESAVRNEQWAVAREHIAQARRFNRAMPEIEYLDLMIRILPDFRRGQKAMDLGLYQEAWRFFDNVSQIDADFNNVLALMDDCVRRARITTTVIQIAREQQQQSVERSVVTSIKQEILNERSPFVRLVARDDLEFLLEEQRNSMSGAFDEDAIIQAGRLLGAEYVILGEMVRYDLKTEIRETRQKGYAGRNALARKVEYLEIDSKRSIDAVYRYYLIKSETAEVVVAETIPYYQEETKHWAEYDGDHGLLHPGHWMQIGMPSLQDRVFPDQKRNLDKLLKADRVHTHSIEFERSFTDLVSREVATRVVNYAAERRVGS